MSSKIIIPVSVVFFPITLPVLLIRLAVFAVVATAFAPVTLVTWLYKCNYRYLLHCERGFLWVPRCEFLSHRREETELPPLPNETEPKARVYDVRQVKMIPSFMGRILGWKTKIRTVWDCRDYLPPVQHHLKFFYAEDGSPVPDIDRQVINDHDNWISKQKQKQKAQEQASQATQEALAVVSKARLVEAG